MNEKWGVVIGYTIFLYYMFSAVVAAIAFCCYCRFMGHSVAVLWISATPGRARPGAGTVIGPSRVGVDGARVFQRRGPHPVDFRGAEDPHTGRALALLGSLLEEVEAVEVEYQILGDEFPHFRAEAGVEGGRVGLVPFVRVVQMLSPKFQSPEMTSSLGLVTQDSEGDRMVIHESVTNLYASFTTCGGDVY